jgi:hypothetical protein
MTTETQGDRLLLVTIYHSPPRDFCDDPERRCGLPPSGAVSLEVSRAEHRPGAAHIPGWVDGHGLAVITWGSWDGPRKPADPGEIGAYTATISNSREVLAQPGSIDRYSNMELAGGWLVGARP